MKQVVITGSVGDRETWHAPGLDDITFCNQTCDQESTGIIIMLGFGFGLWWGWNSDLD